MGFETKEFQDALDAQEVFRNSSCCADLRCARRSGNHRLSSRERRQPSFGIDIHTKHSSVRPPSVGTPRHDPTHFVPTVSTCSQESFVSKHALCRSVVCISELQSIKKHTASIFGSDGARGDHTLAQVDSSQSNLSPQNDPSFLSDLAVFALCAVSLHWFCAKAVRQSDSLVVLQHVSFHGGGGFWGCFTMSGFCGLESILVYCRGPFKSSGARLRNREGSQGTRKFVLFPDDGHSRANAELSCCSFAAYFHPCRSRTWGFSWWFSACARPSLQQNPDSDSIFSFAHHLRPRHLTHSSSFLNTMATMILPVCLAPPQSFPRLASCPACLATNPVILAFLPPETASSQSSKPKDPLSVYLSYLLLGKHLKWPPLGMGGGREGGSKRGRNNRLGEQKSSVDCAPNQKLLHDAVVLCPPAFVDVSFPVGQWKSFLARGNWKN